MKRALYIVVMALAFAGAVFAADKKDEAEALLQRAGRSSNLRLPGVPHSVAATFQLLDAKGKLAGKYELQFRSPRDWREAYSVAGYSEETVVIDGKMTRARKEKFSPIAFQLLVRAMNPLREIQASPWRSLEKLSERTVEGGRATCAKYAMGRGTSVELCAADDGRLMKITEHQPSLAQKQTEFLFTDHTKVGTGYLARRVTIKRDGRASMTINVDQTAETSDQIARHFPNPPPFDYCASGELSLAHLAPLGNSFAPKYPPESRQAHEQGSVMVAVRIAPDGSVNPLGIVESAGPRLDKATVEAITHWKYVPANCGGTPMNSEVAIQVNYELNP